MAQANNKPYRAREYPLDMMALLKLPTREFQMFYRHEGDTAAVLVGFSPSVRMIDLTALTIEELDLLQKFWNKAFDEARPICANADAMAAVALEQGDIRHRRLYRPKPVYAEMEVNRALTTDPGTVPSAADAGGNEQEHDPGLPGRP